jgi:hypothetical protein
MKDIVCVEFSGGLTERIHHSKFDRGCLYGGAVLGALPWLDELAVKGGTAPLSRFLQHGEGETWHPATDGHRTAEYLLGQAREQANRGGPEEQQRLKNVIWDLSVIATLLHAGADEGANFHLALSR